MSPSFTAVQTPSAGGITVVQKVKSPTLCISPYRVGTLARELIMR